MLNLEVAVAVGVVAVGVADMEALVAVVEGVEAMEGVEVEVVEDMGAVNAKIGYVFHLNLNPFNITVEQEIAFVLFKSKVSYVLN